MRPAVLLFTVAAAIAAAGCGSEIGDSCSLNSDCSQKESRVCDTNSTDGYCTKIGCDYGTCPDEAECVRFFTGSFANKSCTPATEDCTATSCPGVTPTDDCSASELCALDGRCVTRNSEIRYCMRKCSSGGDCRDHYECRNGDLMKMHGGEPVPPPDQRLGDSPQPFCAQAPTSLPIDAGVP
jgi:hypothetical protein